MSGLSVYYTVGKWADLDNYECQLCPFTTTDGILHMLGHLRYRHGELLDAMSQLESADEAEEEE